MYKALITDDEHKLREVLKFKLNQHCPEVNIIGEAENITQAQEIISKNKIDILFLDISMPGGSGFDLIDAIEIIDFEIIFVTGHDEYALDALKVSAVDYLLKPIRTEQLVAAVGRATAKVDISQKAKKYETLRHNINFLGDQQTRIAIPGSDAYDFVQISNIIRCEGWNKYTKIFIKNEKSIVSSYNIGVFKEMLQPYGFYSCHKSHIVNKSLIVKYLKEGIIVMNDGSQVPLARRRKDQFVTEVMSNIIVH